FTAKLPTALAALDERDVAFRIPAPIGLEDMVITGANTTVALKAPVKGATIRYTTNGSEPTASSLKYTRPFIVTPPANGTVVVKCLVITASGRQSRVHTATYTRKSYK